MAIIPISKQHITLETVEKIVTTGGKMSAQKTVDDMLPCSLFHGILFTVFAVRHKKNTLVVT